MAHVRTPVYVNKLAKRLRRQVGQAIQDFNMIEAGDRMMACLPRGHETCWFSSGNSDGCVRAPAQYAMIDCAIYESRQMPANMGDLCAIVGSLLSQVGNAKPGAKV